MYGPFNVVLKPVARRPTKAADCKPADDLPCQGQENVPKSEDTSAAKPASPDQPPQKNTLPREKPVVTKSAADAGGPVKLLPSPVAATPVGGSRGISKPSIATHSNFIHKPGRLNLSDIKQTQVIRFKAPKVPSVSPPCTSTPMESHASLGNIQVNIHKGYTQT